MRGRIVFDLDGTLVDSVPTIAGAANSVLEALGRPHLPLSRHKVFVGHGLEWFIERMLEETGGVPEDGLAPAVAQYREIYAASPLAGTIVYDGARAALDALSAAGHGLAVCTQKSNGPARDIVRALGLMPPIAGITGGDSLDVLKPDPAMLWHAAEQIGAGPVVMVGDSEIDAATAAAAGVPFVLHLPGYRHGPVEDIARDAAFEDYAELPGIVANLLAR